MTGTSRNEGLDIPDLASGVNPVCKTQGMVLPMICFPHICSFDPVDD